MPKSMSGSLYKRSGEPQAPLLEAREAEGNESTMQTALHNATTGRAESRARVMVEEASNKSKTPPTMHDGGVVKRDGLHNLQKGEVVIPKDADMDHDKPESGLDKAAKAISVIKGAASLIPGLGGIVPSMHSGGKVKKDGLHNLQKGEVVIAKDKVKDMKNAKVGLMAGMSEAAEEKSEPKDNKKEEKSEKKSPAKKHGIKHHIIHHHPNGSHTLTAVHQSMEDGKPGEEVSAAVPDDAGMHAMLDQNLGGGEPAPAMSAGPAGSAQA